MANYYNRRFTAAAIVALLFLLLDSSHAIAQPIPSPHGISGYVYDLDGVTQAAAGTDFSINNTANGNFLKGRTGKPGSPGKYVATINGNDGDKIIISAWNSDHISTRNVSLLGMMREVNLLLNLTLANYPPVITSFPVTAAKEDYVYTYTVTATDADNDALNYSLLSSPTGMAIGKITGIITWTPTRGQVGSNSVTVQVSDGKSNTSQDFVVVVEHTNHAPVITSTPVTTGDDDSSYTYTVTATDPDGDSLIYLLTKAPAGMAIDSGTGAISWLPQRQDVGLNNVNVTVSDGNGGTAGQAFTISISHINHKPEILSAPVTEATQGIKYYYDVGATDKDGDVLTYSLITSPDGMAINPATGTISWTPTNSQVGSNNVVVRVRDSSLYVEQSFAINAANVNDLPVIISLPPTAATQDVQYSYQVVAYDLDNDVMAYGMANSPENMTINRITGMISWKPTNSQTGPNNVTVEVSDGTGTTTQIFTIMVENVNDAPAIVSPPVTAATQGVLYSYTVNATDPDKDPLTYILKQAPQGMLMDTTSGIILWIPAEEHVGNNQVTIQASDGSIAVNQSFVVAVENVNNAPIITSLPVLNATANEPYTYDVNATDPDKGDVLNYSLIQIPDKANDGKMAINSTTGVITWTPRPSSAGNNKVTVQVSDGSLAMNQSFTIVVSKGKEEDEPIPAYASSGGAGSSGGLNAAIDGTADSLGQPKIIVVEKGNVPISELIIRFKFPIEGASVDVSLLDEKPPEARSIQKRVYGYMEIKKVNFGAADMQEAQIGFRVDKEWLAKNRIESGNVALNRYSNSAWNELPTTKTGEDGKFAYYRSETPGFSLFAIAVKSEAGIEKINEELEIPIDAEKQISQAFSIAGVMLKADKKMQVDYNTTFSIENMDNGDEVTGATGIGPAPGMFFAIISGKPGDKMRMKVWTAEKYAEMNFTLADSISDASFVVDYKKGIYVLGKKAGNRLDTITGFSILQLGKPGTGIALSILATIAAIALAAARHKKKAARKRKKRR